MKRFKKITCGCLSAALMVTALAAGPITAEAAAPKLNKTSATLAVGKKMTLKVRNIKTGTAVKWSSTKKTVATVSSKGVVTAKAAGKTTIKAVVSKKTLKCSVEVKDTAASTSKDISKLLAGKTYKGTAATVLGNINVLNITFGSDGTATGSKMNEETLILEEFSGTYKATLDGKTVTITIKANGKTLSEKLTVEKSDYSKLSAKKSLMGQDFVVSVEEVDAP